MTAKPVIGVGGVRSIADVVKYLMAGAAAVQVCSLAILQGQEVYGKLAEGLSVWLDAHGFRLAWRKSADCTAGSGPRPQGRERRRGWAVRRRTSRGAAGERLRDPGDPAANPYPAIDAELCDLCLACQRACIHRAIGSEDKIFQLDPHPSA